MRQVAVTLYQVTELSPEARARAITAHHKINVDHQWWGIPADYFRHIASCLGLTLDKGEPSFSGFGSQGDGASFTGVWRGDEIDLTALQEYTPHHPILRTIAAELTDIATHYPHATTKIRRDSYLHYVHPYTMTTRYSEWGKDDPTSLHDSVDAALLQALRDLADWYYRSLQTEHERLTSDEAIEETLLANDIEFLSDGRTSPY